MDFRYLFFKEKHKLKTSFGYFVPNKVHFSTTRINNNNNTVLTIWNFCKKKH